jgi:hypothetical protein
MCCIPNEGRSYPNEFTEPSPNSFLFVLLVEVLYHTDNIDARQVPKNNFFFLMAKRKVVSHYTISALKCGICSWYKRLIAWWSLLLFHY